MTPHNTMALLPVNRTIIDFSLCNSSWFTCPQWLSFLLRLTWMTWETAQDSALTMSSNHGDPLERHDDNILLSPHYLSIDMKWSKNKGITLPPWPHALMWQKPATLHKKTKVAFGLWASLIPLGFRYLPYKTRTSFSLGADLRCLTQSLLSVLLLLCLTVHGSTTKKQAKDIWHQRSSRPFVVSTD